MMAKSSARSRCFQRNWLFSAICLTLLSSTKSLLINTTCPFDGLLVLRPVDPFITVGGTAPLCCLTVEPKTLKKILPQQKLDLVFTGPNGVVIEPIMAANNANSNDNATAAACVQATVNDVDQKGFYSCHVVNQSQCQASQYITVDHPLPSTLSFTCITYGSDNVTCSLKDVPTFIHSDRVSSVIKYVQTQLYLPQKPRLFSKRCHRYNSCVLSPRDGIIFGLPLEFNMSVVMEYDPPGDHRYSVSSDWITYNIMTNVLLPPLQASISGITRTTISIKWNRQFSANSDKTIHINYLADQEGWRTYNTLEVTEIMMFRTDPFEVVLRALRPSTMYMIALRTKTVESQSNLWSEPTYLTATTLP